MSDQGFEGKNNQFEGLTEQKGAAQETLQLRQSGETYKSFKKLFLMTLNLCMSSFYFGYNLAYFGTFQFSVLYEVFSISMDKDVAEGLLQGCIPIGAGIGAVLSFLLLKHFSRRQSLLVVNGVALVVGFLIFIPNQLILFAGRFIQGMCVGAYSAVVPLIIKEMAPTEISGTLGALNQVLIAFGVFFACLFQYVLLQINSESDHWRIVFGFTIVTTLLQTVFLSIAYRFETPKYLLEKNRQSECRRVLEWVYKQEHVEEVLEKKREDIASGLKGANEGKSHNKRRTFLAIHLAVLQQFAGINSVVGYGSKIVSQIIPDYKNLIPVFLNFEQIVAGVIVTFLLTKFGRKAILQCGTLVAVLALVIIAVGFLAEGMPQNLKNGLVIVGLVIFMANFGLSLGPIVWLYIPEIVEPEVVPFSTLSNWASAAIVMILFPIMIDKLGNSGPLFLFFALWSLASFCLNQRLVIETKGKTEKQIYSEFEGKAKHS